MNEKPRASSEINRRDLVVRMLAALALTPMHGAIAHALEGLKGLRWSEGVEKLRASARNDAVEQLGIFNGSRDQGRWTDAVTGSADRVHLSSAELAERASRLDMTSGAEFWHTHPAAAIMRGLGRIQRPGSESAHVRDALRLSAAQSGGDVALAASGTVELYLRKKGVVHAPLMHGVVSPYDTWALRPIDWTEANKLRYPDDYARHVERQAAHERILKLLVDWLESLPETERLFEQAFSSTPWMSVVHSAHDRADALARLHLSGELDMTQEPWKSLFFERRDIPRGVSSARLAYLTLSSSSFALHKSHLVEQVVRGKPFAQAVEELQGTVRKVGYELILN